MIVVIVMTSSVDQIHNRPFVVDWLDEMNDDEKDECKIDADCYHKPSDDGRPEEQRCAVLMHFSNDLVVQEQFANSTFTIQKCVNKRVLERDGRECPEHGKVINIGAVGNKYRYSMMAYCSSVKIMEINYDHDAYFNIDLSDKQCLNQTLGSHCD